jgi:hypothetical protein
LKFERRGKAKKVKKKGKNKTKNKAKEINRER